MFSFQWFKFHRRALVLCFAKGNDSSSTRTCGLIWWRQFREVMLKKIQESTSNDANWYHMIVACNISIAWSSCRCLALLGFVSTWLSHITSLSHYLGYIFHGHCSLGSNNDYWRGDIGNHAKGPCRCNIQLLRIWMSGVEAGYSFPTLLSLQFSIRGETIWSPYSEIYICFFSFSQFEKWKPYITWDKQALICLNTNQEGRKSKLQRQIVSWASWPIQVVGPTINMQWEK